MLRDNNSNERISVFTFTSEYPPDPIAGIGTHVFELTSGLKRLGVQITILVPTLSASAVSEHGSARVHRISLREATSKTGGKDDVERIVGANEYFAEYAKHLIDSGNVCPDIIHCHDWYGFPAAYQLGRRFGIPVISTVHMLNEPVSRWWGWTPHEQVIAIERLLCRESDALIAVSQSMGKIIVETHNVSLQRIHVVHNGLDIRPFLKSTVSNQAVSQWQNSLGLKRSKVVLFAGRISPQKGISAMLESAAEIVEADALVRYLVAGDPGGLNPGGPIQFARHLKEVLFPQYSERLWSRIEFVGRVTRHQLAELYQVADLVLIPSIYENSPYAGFEAMAAGRPIVATAVGGLAEVIQDNVTGLLVPVHRRNEGTHTVDVGRLITAQIEMLNDREKAERMGKNGQQRLIKEFGLERMVSATLNIYRQIVHGRTENVC